MYWLKKIILIIGIFIGITGILAAFTFEFALGTLILQIGTLLCWTAVFIPYRK